MKILFIAFSESIHTARWISLINKESWNLNLFPSIDQGVTNSALCNINIYHTFYSDRTNKKVSLYGYYIPNPTLEYLCRGVLNKWKPDRRANDLVRLIKKINPDIIHSLEFQAGGYLTLEAKRRYGPDFPPWIATNWGSDIFLFGRLKAHREKVKEVLRECDYYSCECLRDVDLAKDLGFRGKILPVLPNTGGFNLDHINSIVSKTPPTERRLILLKGYQGWAGRALVGLRALALCRDALKGYQIAVYGVLGDDVRIAAELLEQEIGVPVIVVPYCSHDEILELFGKARVYIGLSISDAISTSLLEAMAMGTFPIQSSTACADEWITDGASGIIVPPEDPQVVSEAIRTALLNDTLVNEAAKINLEIVKRRLNRRIIREQVIRMYRYIYNETRST